MKITRRQFLLGAWGVCVIGAGLLVLDLFGSLELGLVISLSLVAISLGVPLMRAMTEFSK